MVDCTKIILGLVLFGFITVEGRYRQKRQAPWTGASTSWFNNAGLGTNWNLMSSLFNQGTGGGTGNSGGNNPPPRNSRPPPPPPPQNQRNMMPPPPLPPQHWNHPPPPPPQQNNWNHPPPASHNNWHHPPANNWHPPPPPPPQNNQINQAGLTALQQQMNLQMLTAGLDTADGRKNLNPAAPTILQYTCPPELPFTQCVMNPCSIRCKRYPMAKCYTNPCGNCAAEWIQNNMKIIDCD